MAEPIDLRTNPQPLSQIPAGSTVTGVNGTDTKWRVLDNAGTLKKVRE